MHTNKMQRPGLVAAALDIMDRMCMLAAVTMCIATNAQWTQDQNQFGASSIVHETRLETVVVGVVVAGPPDHRRARTIILKVALVAAAAAQAGNKHAITSKITAIGRAAMMMACQRRRRNARTVRRKARTVIIVPLRTLKPRPRHRAGGRSSRSCAAWLLR